MVSRNGDDARIRHILRIPQITDAETALAVQKMDSIRNLLTSGAINFKEAAVKYSEDPNAKFTTGYKMARDNSTYLTIDQLDKEVVKLLKDLKVGEYSQPTSFTDDRGKKGVHIIELISKSDPHRENLRDDYNRVSERALAEKKQAALEKWFKSKIPTYYILIDDEYKSCPNLHKWQTNATANN
jgi:peptidyl-prolyl cis-trans isomerase SurA